MNGKEISMAMSDIDEDLIEEARWEEKAPAASPEKRKRRIRYTVAAWGMAAACLLLFAGVQVYQGTRLPRLYLQGQEVGGEGILVSALVSPMMLAEHSGRSSQLSLDFDVRAYGKATARVFYGELEAYENGELIEAGQECSLNGEQVLVWYLLPEPGESYELVISQGHKSLRVSLEFDEADQEWKIYSEK